MKTKIFYTGIILMISLISFNVYAEGKGSLNHKVNSLAVLTECMNFEKEMELESWMLSVKEFNTTGVIFEDEMKYESWMLTPFAPVNSSDNSFDKELVMETWMINPFVFNNNNSFRDEEMVYEPWMLKFWK